ncbi:WDR24 [Lepeophtheirus salmonis]|uniref:GATOR2 complex protein WDR24 n=1 Tax=Lepeophtheirus salmonis TaxID=72036 RepID=A0A7R8H431_LEPSM|nr:WDR24 [Lepeophtheirus salmonis]CAF2850933.1 WDR24 [Lepeophtheirus salmonis]
MIIARPIFIRSREYKRLSTSFAYKKKKNTSNINGNNIKKTTIRIRMKKAYRPTSLEEVTSLKGDRLYGLVNVRVYGKISERSLVEEILKLSSIAEEVHSQLEVDFKLILKENKVNCRDNGVVVVAHMVRDFSDVRPQLYQKYVSHFPLEKREELIEAKKVINLPEASESQFKDLEEHRNDENLIASAAANGAIVLWNLASLHEGVRDVQFNPHNTHQFASVSDNGRVQLWDLRKTDKCEKQWPAHDGYVFGCDWHPEIRNTLATAGRDKSIKIWDTGPAKATCDYFIGTIGPVGKVKWRPKSKNQLASSALSPIDFTINILQLPLSGKIPIQILFYHLVRMGFCAFTILIPPINQQRGQILLEFVLTLTTSIGVNGSKMGGLFKKSSQSLGGDDFVAPESKLRTYQNKYLLSGDSLDKLCDHNSSVAQSLNHDVGTDEPETDTDKPPLNETRTRHYSSGSSFQNSRSSGNPLGLSNLSNTNQVCSRTGSGNERFNSGGYNNNYNNSEEESDSDDDNEDSYEKTLSNIASGQKLSGDFFGDSEFSSLCVDQLIAVDNSYKSDMIDWTLPCEAFDPRHDMKASTNHAESEEYLQQHGEESSGVDDNVHSVAVPESNNDSLEYLKVDTLSLFPVWSPKPIVKDTLVFYAERGDVQTVVSIYLVLGHDRIGGLIQDSILENWFSAYIDLLHQFQMYNKATEIINLCSFQPGIYQMSQLSTTYFINCTNCSKALNRNPMWCNRCQTFPNQCAVCHRVVKGLFVWCQGCGHGGHIEHLSEWLEKNTLCPTGCGHGHHCEYH